MNELSYILAFAIGVVAIIVGAADTAAPSSQAFIVFGIWAVLSTVWAAIWKARGEIGFDIKEKSIFAKFSSVGEVVTIPIIVGAVIGAIIVFIL